MRLEIVCDLLESYVIAISAICFSVSVFIAHTFEQVDLFVVFATTYLLSSYYSPSYVTTTSLIIVYH